MSDPVVFTSPIAAVSEANRRDHWAAKAKRVKKHREAAFLLCPVFPLPCVVTLTRIAPRELDSDNLSSSCKAARDGIADRLGIDDRDPRVEWRYAQRKGKAGVEVELTVADRLPGVNSVAILFARADSVYKTLLGCDVYDIERDARTWPGGCPVVAHPPCRAWGRLATFAKPRDDEKPLALFAVEQVRQWGGVLEHPAGSTLWAAAGLPEPGKRDAGGGFTLVVDQHWWGHKAEKRTRLYVCGVEPSEVPAMPYTMERPTHCVAPPHGMRAGHPDWRTIITKREREATPAAFAAWLVELARMCKQAGRHLMPATLVTLPTGTTVETHTCDRCGQVAHWGFGGKWACSEHRQETEREWVSEAISQRASER